jgi:hypothetical protein
MTEENSDDEMYCEKHELKSPAYECGTDPHCPYCREERRRENLIAERAARRSDPRMHPTVDAPMR